MSDEPNAEHRLCGLLTGTAVGDALGLPYEGLPRRRVEALVRWPLGHRFLFGRGMVSDDTEHALMTARALLASPADPKAFRRRLAESLRFWLLRLPPGVGLATLRSVARLWAGIPPERSGVRSAGNGPLMRAPVIGCFHAAAPELRRAFVASSTAMTHADPRALTAALAVAEAAALAAAGRRPGIGELAAALAGCGEDAEWRRALGLMAKAGERGSGVREFAAALGCADGVSGYAYHSGPVAVYAWWRHHGDYARTVSAAVACGGDTDSVAAVAGALAGATVGLHGIPTRWKAGLADRPVTVAALCQHGRALAQAARSGLPTAAPPLGQAAAVPRNLLFLAVCVAHVARRLLPPYAPSRRPAGRGGG